MMTSLSALLLGLRVESRLSGNVGSMVLLQFLLGGACQAGHGALIVGASQLSKGAGSITPVFS
ncbi:hypothetical protein [Propionivibrio sp.]|uniref:hypothetical protein n=1 Tax=Propionivibrio sp. TaxID=2212460 RepID=UPI0025E51757|nr:hypothetical protein [Propionivibrio sp.]